MEAPPAKESDPPEAEEQKQVTMPNAVKDTEQPEPVKEIVVPKGEEVKAQAEPIHESKSPVKEGSFSEFVQ